MAGENILKREWGFSGIIMLINFNPELDELLGLVSFESEYAPFALWDGNV